MTGRANGGRSGDFMPGKSRLDEVDGGWARNEVSPPPPPPPHTHTRAVFPLSGLRLDWMDRVGSRQPSSFSSFFVSSEHSTYVPNYNIAAQPQPVERVIHLCRQAEVHTPDIRKAWPTTLFLLPSVRWAPDQRRCVVSSLQRFDLLLPDDIARRRR